MSMKANYRIMSGKLVFQVEAENDKDLFGAIARIGEIFDAEAACGVCDEPDPRFVHRVVTKGSKKFDYYELHCRNQECRARFAFGQLSDSSGGLFPKRRGEDGKWLDHGGWTRYRPGGSAPGAEGPEPTDDDVPF